MWRLLTRRAVFIALMLVAVVYGFDAGHGFVKDDFGWILTSRVERAGDLVQWLGAPMGFFRPLVSMSFAIDYALFGLSPLGYGLTNLVLLVACIGVLFRFFCTAGLRSGVASGAALVWALNFQGINMAVLWTSGRTALMVTFWAAAAAAAWLRRRHAAAALLSGAAMWSKEEGFVVPAILTVWSIIDARRPAAELGSRTVRVVRDTWLLWVVTVISLIARAQSGAFTPSSAPAVYRYQFDLATLAGNLFQYADRAATTPILALLVFWLAAGCPRLDAARSEEGADKGIVKGVVWLLLGFAPTIFLPVRSSLYAVMPSVGVVLVAGVVVDRMTARVSPAALERAVAVMLVLVAALVPVYRSRNTRYVREAELSTAIVGEVSKIAAARRDGGLVVIKDVRDGRPTAEQAFGPLADRMAALVTVGTLQIWIDPPPAELAGVAPPDLRRVVATLVVERGRVSVDREIRSR